MKGTVKCPICGKPYKWYSHTVADQSACPKCVSYADEETRLWLSDHANGGQAYA